jgi:hypothetical protein
MLVVSQQLIERSTLMDLFAPVSLATDLLAPALGVQVKTELDLIRENILDYEYLLSRSWRGFHFGRNRIDFIGFDNLMMVDWDIADAEPDEKHYTVSSFEEIQQLIAERVNAHPYERWALYRTPGGGHAFLISHYTPVERGIEIQSAMRGDKLYSMYCGWNKAYNCRISQKAGRSNDFISSFVRCYGGGIALPEQERLLEIHDLFIYGRTYRP